MSVTVFVAGIHGAGKSTICRELGRLLGVFHATAGDLIRANANATTEVTVGVKAVPKVDANQLLLLRELAAYRARNTGPLLLDGHFVLLKPDRAIAEIPVVGVRGDRSSGGPASGSGCGYHPFPAAGT
ncbi:MAG: ATP-binding protein [Thermoguttaceae bacterium]